uniref:Cadherin N-terminal domain-containing protein n=1 Tax=Oryzias melastigma TaxID=30732 RepID=A0A3B3D2G7_ORYME
MCAGEDLFNIFTVKTLKGDEVTDWIVFYQPPSYSTNAFLIQGEEKFKPFTGISSHISKKSFCQTMDIKRQWRDGRFSLCLALLILTRFDEISAQLRYSIQEELKPGSGVGNVAKDLGLDLKGLTDRNLRVVSGTNERVHSGSERQRSSHPVSSQLQRFC